MPTSFPAKGHRLVQSRIALLLDYRRAVRDSGLEQLHDFGLGLVSVTRWIVFVRSEVGPHFRSRNPADDVVINGGNVEKVFRKGALVLLYFELVPVFGEVFGHGDELVADVVPPLKSFIR